MMSAAVPIQDALAICQAVNEREANSIFYSSNHFNAVDSYITRETSDLKAFLDFLSPCYSSLLSSISISFPILQAEQGQSQQGCRQIRLTIRYISQINQFKSDMEFCQISQFKYNVCTSDISEWREATLDKPDYLYVPAPESVTLPRCYRGQPS
ncbi:Uncharacterized protein HZ326_30397 [Fusarium oxysporum f. sp. albedinis]|nr:Uncharacterized protein HZ326_30397 [Fusarium oxysporum f. sp. albedinis]